jgi:hypothetical protein
LIATITFYNWVWAQSYDYTDKTIKGKKPYIYKVQEVTKNNTAGSFITARVTQ